MIVFGFGGEFGFFDVDFEDGGEDGAADPTGEDRVKWSHFGAVVGDGVNCDFVGFYRVGEEIGDDFWIITK